MKHHSERRKLRDHTEHLLTALGTEPGQVARSLAAAGVKGVPSNYFDCAIAVYLGAVVGVDPQVEHLKVSKGEVMIERGRWWRRPVVVSLPAAVRDFIVAFDARGYPDLIRPGAAPRLPVKI